MAAGNLKLEDNGVNSKLSRRRLPLPCAQNQRPLNHISCSNFPVALNLKREASPYTAERMSFNPNDARFSQNKTSAAELHRQATTQAPIVNSLPSSLVTEKVTEKVLVTRLDTDEMHFPGNENRMAIL